SGHQPAEGRVHASTAQASATIRGSVLSSARINWRKHCYGNTKGCFEARRNGRDGDDRSCLAPTEAGSTKCGAVSRARDAPFGGSASVAANSCSVCRPSADSAGNSSASGIRNRHLYVTHHADASSRPSTDTALGLQRSLSGSDIRNHAWNPYPSELEE